MNKIQKFSLVLGSIFTLAISSNIALANEVGNTKIDMQRNDQVITTVISRNIPEEKLNTKVDMQRSNQIITPVIATNIPDEKINTKVDIQRDNQIITPVPARNITN